MRDNQHRPRRTNGVHRPGARARALPLAGHDAPTEETEPLDLVAVQADDELINALSAGYPVSQPGLGGGYDADDRVAAILAAWKAEVEAEPVPELVDLDTAVAAVRAGQPGRAWMRHLAPVAAAAAFVVLTVGGISVGSHSAEPGDVLWPVSKVLYAERAGSVEAAQRAEEHIDRAKQALVAGQPAVAAAELQQARADLAAVRPEEGQADLMDVQDFLLAKAAETPEGTPADLDAPLATEPTRPVPSLAAVPPLVDESPVSSSPLSQSPLPVSPPAPAPAGPSRPPLAPAPQPQPDPADVPEPDPVRPTSDAPAPQDKAPTGPEDEDPAPGTSDGAAPDPSTTSNEGQPALEPGTGTGAPPTS